MSVMHDDAGPPRRGEPLKDSPGKRMADLIGVFLMDHNFEVVMEKVMGNVDEAVAWMKDAYRKRKKRVREASSSQCIVDEVSDLWELLRNAIVSTQITFSHYQLTCSRAPVSHELKWRGRRGIEKGVETAK